MRATNLLAWFETELGLKAFVDAVKQLVTAEEYAKLLKWASPRGPRLSAVEHEWAQRKAEELLERLTAMYADQGRRSRAVATRPAKLKQR